uniref:N-acetylmuramoyl-L-alanine amidase n=1 Tax=Christensenella minuta TaxID=626937 RepID=UPI0021580CA7
NAGGGEGAECLIVTGASATSREMAQAIQSALVGVGFRDRGVKVQDRNTYVLSHTTMPATTIECGFVDNAGDNALFDSKFNEIVQGITDAVLSIAGGVAPNTVTPPAPSVAGGVVPNTATPPSPSVNVPELTRVLKRGCKGDDVMQAQERLNHHKANAGKVDGVFGTNTYNAVLRFQQARINEGRDVGCRYNDNKPDGKCGELTWAILHEPAPGE